MSIKKQVLIWTEKTSTIEYNDFLTHRTAQDVSIKSVNSLDGVTTELVNNANVMLLIIIKDFNEAELSQVQKLATYHPCTPLLMFSKSQFSAGLVSFSRNLIKTTISNCLAKVASNESNQQANKSLAEKPSIQAAANVSAIRTEHPNLASEDCLTSRQKQVLELIVSGKSNKQIARELFVSEGTVKVHCMAIFREIGVNNRTQAALHANDFLKQA